MSDTTPPILPVVEGLEEHPADDAGAVGPGAAEDAVVGGEPTAQQEGIPPPHHVWPGINWDNESEPPSPPPAASPVQQLFQELMEQNADSDSDGSMHPSSQSWGRCSTADLSQGTNKTWSLDDIERIASMPSDSEEEEDPAE